MTRALAMMSGGLDSTLAAKVIKDQGIEVIGICFKSYFFGESNAKRMCDQIGISLEVVDFIEDHFEMVKNPKHGYGKNMNPCIDCHAMMMRYSGELLKKFDADFIITGEVVNQRPMSQNRQALNTVINESGYKGKILRPLCAKHLAPTEMELNGLVDREKLFDFNGKNRKPQIALAKELGIKDYPSPAGGCKLTEPGYGKRLRELLDKDENPSRREIEALRFGRHFRVDDKTKIISTRTAEEVEPLKAILSEEDFLFIAEEFKGSMIVVMGEKTDEAINIAAAITARYSKGKDEESISVNYGPFKREFKGSVTTSSLSEEKLNKYLI